MKIQKWFIEELNWLEWISAGIGVIFLLLGAISLIIGRVIVAHHFTNLLLSSCSFFLLTIVLFLFIHFGQFKKE